MKLSEGESVNNKQVKTVLSDCINDIIATRCALELMARDNSDWGIIANHFQKVLGQAVMHLQDTVEAYLRGCE